MKESLGNLVGRALDNVGNLLGDSNLAAVVKEQLKVVELTLPLIPRNTFSVGAEVVWPIFSGGKRVIANRIGGYVARLATENRRAVEGEVVAEVVGAYFAVQLWRNIVETRELATAAMEKHKRQAERLAQEGMITKSERLAVEVDAQQSNSQLLSARSSLHSAQLALGALLGVEGCEVEPITPIMPPREIAQLDSLLKRLKTNNFALRAAALQQDIAQQKLAASRSDYLPEVALMAHQQLYAKGLNTNMFPKTFVGVGLSWTLFDGFAREMEVQASKAELKAAEIAENEVANRLEVTVKTLYGQLESIGKEDVTLSTAERLAAEVVEARQRAFTEGLATAAEVSDAIVEHAQVRVARLTTQYKWWCALAELLHLCGEAEEIVSYCNTTNYGQ